MRGKKIARCQATIGKANRVLGFIHRWITYKSEVVLTQSSNLVRPHFFVYIVEAGGGPAVVH